MPQNLSTIIHSKQHFFAVQGHSHLDAVQLHFDAVNACTVKMNCMCVCSRVGCCATPLTVWHEAVWRHCAFCMLRISTVLCDYKSEACKAESLSYLLHWESCFCIFIKPSFTADRFIWLILLQLQASVARLTRLDCEARLACASHLEESLDKQAASFTKKSALETTKESVTRAGFEISRIIACHMKPFTDGEYIKDCVLSAVDAVCPAERKKMAGLCLSAHTITCRTEHMTGNVCATLSQTCTSLEFFSIDLDESTDLKDTSQFVVFIRGVTASFTVVEEFLQMVPLHGRTTGKIMCDPQLPLFYWPLSSPPGVHHHWWRPCYGGQGKRCSVASAEALCWRRQFSEDLQAALHHTPGGSLCEGCNADRSDERCGQGRELCLG